MQKTSVYTKTVSSANPSTSVDPNSISVGLGNSSVGLSEAILALYTQNVSEDAANLALDSTLTTVQSSLTSLTATVQTKANTSNPIVTGALEVVSSYGQTANPSLKLTDSVGGNNVQIIPNSGPGGYNPSVHGGSTSVVALNTTSNTARLDLTCWSDTNSGVTIGPTEVALHHGGQGIDGNLYVQLDGNTNRVYVKGRMLGTTELVHADSTQYTQKHYVDTQLGLKATLASSNIWPQTQTFTVPPVLPVDSIPKNRVISLQTDLDAKATLATANIWPQTQTFSVAPVLPVASIPKDRVISLQADLDAKAAKTYVDDSVSAVVTGQSVGQRITFDAFSQTGPSGDPANPYLLSYPFMGGSNTGNSSGYCPKLVYVQTNMTPSTSTGSWGGCELEISYWTNRNNKLSSTVDGAVTWPIAGAIHTVKRSIPFGNGEVAGSNTTNPTVHKMFIHLNNSNVYGVSAKMSEGTINGLLTNISITSGNGIQQTGGQTFVCRPVSFSAATLLPGQTQRQAITIAYPNYHNSPLALNGGFTSFGFSIAVTTLFDPTGNNGWFLSDT